ncbi:YHS domain-containing (seleno)protein [Desulfogranum japonicum]|uniref:YHS domain-containing (seleno)protein n=1 Tax=Desulfogranum japonicum TaxID=231447 RepID=UPI000410A3DB|nr:YHS domain-containing (seleno)protein [Desulfogranum japonicum]
MQPWILFTRQAPPLFILLLLLLLFCVGNTPAVAAEPEIAIKKYDPVVYFTESRAMLGTDEYTFSYHDMIWFFSSQKNRDIFAADPQAYAPQYDGYCAWAMTESRLARTDPEVWKIVDGKLYLNCSRSAYEKWARDIPAHIKKADRIWKEKFADR